MSNTYNYGLYKANKLYNFIDKDKALDNYVRYMLNRTQKMFKWEGLPDTIPQRELELLLQNNGFAIFAEYEGNIYAFNGGLGGEPDVYYQPTLAIVANPALHMSKDYKINEDCVVMRNDSLKVGLLPILCRYCSQLVEADISINLASFNSRIISLISSSDDIGTESAKKFIADIIAGKPGIIAEGKFLDGIKVQPYGSNTNNNIISLLELHKRTFANMYNELGLRDSGEGKRESLNEAEIQSSDQILLPLVDDMLQERKLACELINEMFGLSVSVSLDSSWKDLAEEIEEEHELVEAEIEEKEQTDEDSSLEDSDESNTDEEQTYEEDSEEEKEDED